jgi:hypothetical protein
LVLAVLALLVVPCQLPTRQPLVGMALRLIVCPAM